MGLLILLNVLHWIGITVLVGILFVVGFVMPMIAKHLKMPTGRLRLLVLKQSMPFLIGAVVVVGVTGVGLTAVHWAKMSIPLYAGLVFTKAALTLLLVANLWYMGRSVWKPKKAQQPRTNVIEFQRIRNKKWFTQLAVLNLAGIALILMAAAYLREI
ncbi:MAG: hypothetical protein ACXVP5_06225 [Tumebacillaceae bacterium]